MNRTQLSPLLKRIDQDENTKRETRVRFKGVHSKKNDKGPSVWEMYSSGMKKQFNLTNPENGIKGYNVADPNLKEPYYKIRNIPSYKENKDKSGFQYHHIKRIGNSPAPTKDVPGIVPWGEEKYYTHSGSWR
jgi:hypothetical protein